MLGSTSIRLRLSDQPQKLPTVVMLNPKKTVVKAITALTLRPLITLFHCA